MGRIDQSRRCLWIESASEIYRKTSKKSKWFRVNFFAYSERKTLCIFRIDTSTASSSITSNRSFESPLRAVNSHGYCADINFGCNFSTSISFERKVVLQILHIYFFDTMKTVSEMSLTLRNGDHPLEIVSVESFFFSFSSFKEHWGHGRRVHAWFQKMQGSHMINVGLK